MPYYLLEPPSKWTTIKYLKMFLRRGERERLCRSLPFTFRETNNSQFLLKVVMGPDLDLNQDSSRDGGSKTTLALSRRDRSGRWRL